MSESKESEKGFVLVGVGVAESKHSGSSEESVGDSVLGAVLKEAARMWLGNEGYAGQLREWVDEHKHEFGEYVGVEPEDCEYKLGLYDLHAQYLEMFEGQITKFVERKTDYTVEEFYNECRMAHEVSVQTDRTRKASESSEMRESWLRCFGTWRRRRRRRQCKTSEDRRRTIPSGVRK